ncbi:uracil-DNA glycosylase [Rhizobium sp. LjRoot30]|uniref:uracil-DNA glycosylase n=1 Tax=Rhizobium sp. LjRoot30 TaxID=3342320 RepID=UPI003ECD9FF6
MIAAQDLTAAELAALLHFHADAGVDWMLEEQAVDRFQEFAAAREARRANTPVAQGSPQTSSANRTENRPTAASREKTAQPAIRERPLSAPPAIPDDQAIAQARFAAESAQSLDALRTALENFNSCNLKSTARSTIFAKGDASSGLAIVGPMPNADDDREGEPFAGRTGQLLDRMLASIGLERDKVFLTNILPWRPPGNRMPSQPEMDICRPFIEQQLALAKPRAVLLLGNFSARFFFGGSETIHSVRGQWREISAGSLTVPAIASLHPQELLTAPINKRLAWADLLAFRARAGELLK